MLDLMRDIILATDLAHHLRILKDLQKMADGKLSPYILSQCLMKGSTSLLYHFFLKSYCLLCLPVGYNTKDPQHHNLLLCLIMTSCDLSDQTKDWKTTWKIAVRTHSDLNPLINQLCSHLLYHI